MSSSTFSRTGRSDSIISLVARIKCCGASRRAIVLIEIACNGVGGLSDSGYVSGVTGVFCIVFSLGHWGSLSPVMLELYKRL